MVGNLTIIDSDNGLSPGWFQGIIWTNAEILSIRPTGTNFSEILIEIHTFSFNKTHLKMLPATPRSFCLGFTLFYLKANDVIVMACKLWHKDFIQFTRSSMSGLSGTSDIGVHVIHIIITNTLEQSQRIIWLQSYASWMHNQSENSPTGILLNTNPLITCEWLVVSFHSPSNPWWSQNHRISVCFSWPCSENSSVQNSVKKVVSPSALNLKS